MLAGPRIGASQRRAVAGVNMGARAAARGRMPLGPARPGAFAAIWEPTSAGGCGRVWLTAVPGRMGWPLLPSCKKAKRGPGHRVGAGRMGALNSSLLSLDRFLKSGG